MREEKIKGSGRNGENMQKGWIRNKKMNNEKWRTRKRTENGRGVTEYTEYNEYHPLFSAK